MSKIKKILDVIEPDWNEIARRKNAPKIEPLTSDTYKATVKKYTTQDKENPSDDPMNADYYLSRPGMTEAQKDSAYSSAKPDYKTKINEILSAEDDYDYRGAFLTDTRPDETGHWSSMDGQGKWLKSPKHPTAWKEGYYQVTGENPDAKGIKDFESLPQNIKDKIQSTLPKNWKLTKLNSKDEEAFQEWIKQVNPKKSNQPGIDALFGFPEQNKFNIAQSTSIPTEAQRPFQQKKINEDILTDTYGKKNIVNKNGIDIELRAPELAEEELKSIAQGISTQRNINSKELNEFAQGKKTEPRLQALKAIEESLKNPLSEQEYNDNLKEYNNLANELNSEVERYNQVTDQSKKLEKDFNIAASLLSQKQAENSSVADVPSEFWKTLKYLPQQATGGALNMVNQMLPRGAQLDPTNPVKKSADWMTEQGKLKEKELEPKQGFWAEMGKGAATMAMAAPASIAGTVATGNPVVGFMAGFAPSFVLEGGLAFNEAKENGLSDADATLYSLPVGIINAAIEQFTETGIAKDITRRFSKEVVSELAQKGLLGKVIGAMGKGARGEGSEEGLQEATNLIVETIYKKRGEEPTLNDWLDRTSQSMVHGAILGGLMGGGSLLSHVESKAAADQLGAVKTAGEQRYNKGLASVQSGQELNNPQVINDLLEQRDQNQDQRQQNQSGNLRNQDQSQRNNQPTIDEILNQIPITPKQTAGRGINTNLPIQKAGRINRVQTKEDIQKNQTPKPDKLTDGTREELYNLLSQTNSQEQAEKLTVNFSGDEMTYLLSGGREGKPVTQERIDSILKGTQPKQGTKNVTQKEMQGNQEEVVPEQPVAEKVTKRPLPQTETQPEQKSISEAQVPVLSSGIEAKKADIERRRQEELKQNSYRTRSKSEVWEYTNDNGEQERIEVIYKNNGTKELRALDENGKNLGIIQKDAHKDAPLEKLLPYQNFKLISENNNISDRVSDRINSKYDAELSDLPSGETEKNPVQAEPDLADNQIKNVDTPVNQPKTEVQSNNRQIKDEVKKESPQTKEDFERIAFEDAFTSYGPERLASMTDEEIYNAIPEADLDVAEKIRQEAIKRVDAKKPKPTREQLESEITELKKKREMFGKGDKGLGIPDKTADYDKLIKAREDELSQLPQPKGEDKGGKLPLAEALDKINKFDVGAFNQSFDFTNKSRAEYTKERMLAHYGENLKDAKGKFIKDYTLEEIEKSYPDNYLDDYSKFAPSKKTILDVNEKGDIAPIDNNKSAAFQMFEKGKKDSEVITALGLKGATGTTKVYNWRKEFEKEKSSIIEDVSQDPKIGEATLETLKQRLEEIENWPVRGSDSEYHKKVLDTNKRFLRNLIKTKEGKNNPDKKIKSKNKRFRDPETWQEAVLLYVVQGGQIRASEISPEELRNNYGLTNFNINRIKGMPLDTMISELGFVNNEQFNDPNFQESDLVRDLLSKYNTHAKRVEFLDKMKKGEPEPKEYQDLGNDFAELDEIVLNEYLDQDGNLRLADILGNAKEIADRAKVSVETLTQYLAAKQAEPIQEDTIGFDFDLLDNTIQAGDINEKQVDEFINDTGKEAEDEAIIEDIESKAESSEEIELNEAIQDADELTSSIDDRVKKLERQIQDAQDSFIPNEPLIKNLRNKIEALKDKKDVQESDMFKNEPKVKPQTKPKAEKKFDIENASLTELRNFATQIEELNGDPKELDRIKKRIDALENQGEQDDLLNPKEKDVFSSKPVTSNEDYKNSSDEGIKYIANHPAFKIINESSDHIRYKTAVNSENIYVKGSYSKLKQLVESVSNYIRGLKKGDVITHDSFGKEQTGTITRVNKNSEGKVKSVGVDSSRFKVDSPNIIFRGIKAGDIMHDVSILSRGYNANSQYDKDRVEKLLDIAIEQTPVTPDVTNVTENGLFTKNNLSQFSVAPETDQFLSSRETRLKEIAKENDEWERNRSIEELVYPLSGDANKKIRQSMISVIRGEKVPSNKAGIRELKKEFEKYVNSLRNKPTSKPLYQRLKTSIPETINVDGVDRPTRDNKGNLIHPTLTGIENFWKNFGDSKVVDENGNPILCYSGHGNTPLYKNFNPKKATSGGFYASESPDVASGYANGKWGVREGYDNGEQYRVKGKNGDYNKKLWQVEFTPGQKAKIDELKNQRDKYDNPVYQGLSNMEYYIKEYANYEPDVRRWRARGGIYNLQNIWEYNEQMGYNIAYSTPDKDGESTPTWTRQNKNETEEIMDALGIEWQSYDWQQPGIFPVYLNITKPLDADKPFPQDLLNDLEQAAKYERTKGLSEYNSATWTKDYPLKEWISDIKNDEEGWTTQIPKKAMPILKRYGYDGIKERGNKGLAKALPREQRNINWIAFEPEQIKNAIANKGAFDTNNKDMLKQSLIDRNELQQLQDRKRHLELVASNDKSTPAQKNTAKQEISEINKKLAKINTTESQWDMFGDAQDQISLFRKEANRTRTVYNKMSTKERARFNKIVANSFLQDNPDTGFTNLSKDEAAGVTYLIEQAMRFDPRVADITTAMHEATHMALGNMVAPWKAQRILRDNGWDGKGDYRETGRNKSLTDAYEKIAEASEKWVLTKDPKTFTEKFVAMFKNLLNKLAAFMYNQGFYTQAGFFENLYTGKLREMSLNELGERVGDLVTESALAQKKSITETENFNPSILGKSFSPTWYSKLERVIEDKLQNKGFTKESVLALLRNNGVKEDEIKWMDVEGYFNDKKKAPVSEGLPTETNPKTVSSSVSFQSTPRELKPARLANASIDKGELNRRESESQGVTKKDLLDWIKANQIEIKEVVKVERWEIQSTDQSYKYFTSEEEAQEYLDRENEWIDTEAVTVFEDDGSIEINDHEGNTVYRFDKNEDDGYDEYMWGEDNDKTYDDYDEVKERIEELEEEIKDEWRAILSTEPQVAERGKDVAKFTQWTTPGGTNQREINFVLPSQNKIVAEGYRVPSAHQYGDEADVNRFAHARINDRTVNGKKYLHIEEIQSDWQREGRKQGYKNELDKQFTDASKKWNQYREELAKLTGKQTPAELSQLEKDISIGIPIENVPEKLAEEIRINNLELKRLTDSKKTEGVPPFPFSNNWQEFTMKRILRMAAAEGYDGISWITGEQTAERYDLSKQIDKVLIGKSVTPKDGKYFVQGIKGNNAIITKFANTESEVAELVGKDLAEKAFKNGEPTTDLEFSGLDLKVGGEWATNLYDKQLVNFMDKYAKKWGAKTGEIDLTTQELDFKFHVNDTTEPYEKKVKVHSLDITDQMRSSVLFEGQPLFQKTDNDNLQNMKPEKGQGEPSKEQMPQTPEGRINLISENTGVKFTKSKNSNSWYGETDKYLIRISDHPSKFSEKDHIRQISPSGKKKKSIDLSLDGYSPQAIAHIINGTDPFANYKPGDIIKHNSDIVGDVTYIDSDYKNEWVKVKTKDGKEVKYFSEKFLHDGNELAPIQSQQLRTPKEGVQSQPRLVSEESKEQPLYQKYSNDEKYSVQDMYESLDTETINSVQGDVKKRFDKYKRAMRLQNPKRKITKYYDELLTAPVWFFDKHKELKSIWTIMDKYFVRGINEDRAMLIEDYWKKGKTFRKLPKESKQKLAKALKSFEYEQYLVELNGGKPGLMTYQKFIDTYKLDDETAKFLTDSFSPMMDKALDQYAEVDEYILYNSKTNLFDTPDEFFESHPEAKSLYESALGNQKPTEAAIKKALDLAWLSDPQTRFEITKDLVAEKYDKFRGKVYLPTSRFGKKYFLKGTLPPSNPLEEPEKFFMTSDSSLEIIEVEKDLKSRGFSTQNGTWDNVQEALKDNDLTSADILDLAVLSGLDIDNEIVKKLMNNVIGKGFQRHFIPKRYVPGFQYNDKSIEESVYRFLNGVANYKNSTIGRDQLGKQIQDLETRGLLKADSKERDYINKLKDNIDSYDYDFFRSFRAIASIWALSLRPSYIFQQAVQPFNTLLPELPRIEQELGLEKGEAEKAFVKAIGTAHIYYLWKILDKTQRLTESFVNKLNRDDSDPKGLKPFLNDVEFMNLMFKLERQAVAKPLRTLETFGEMVDPKKHYKTNKIGEAISIGSKIINIPGIAVEDFTRVIGIKALYDMGKKGGLKGEGLENFISEKIARTYGAASGRLSKPPAYTITGKSIGSKVANSISKLYTTFKNFGFLNYGQWGGVFRALNEDNQIRPLAYKLGASVGIGGVKYMAWTATIYSLINALLGWLDEPENVESKIKKIRKNIDEQTGTKIGTIIEKGLLSVATDTDLSMLFSQNAPFVTEDIVFRNGDLLDPKSYSRAFFGAPGEITGQITGKGTLPSGIRNLKKADEMKEKGIKWGKEELIAPEDISEFDVTAKRLGFTTTKISDAYEERENRAFKKKQYGDIVRERVTEEVLPLLRKGKTKQAEPILQELMEMSKDTFTEEQKKKIKGVWSFMNNYVKPRIKNEEELEEIKDMKLRDKKKKRNNKYY